MAVKLESLDQRLRPVRGLILAQNGRNKPFSVLDLKRWLRINRVVFKTHKVDVLTASRAHAAVLPALLEYAGTLDLRLSLRTGCDEPPPDLALLRKAGLLDVMLCPDELETGWFDMWLRACSQAELPIRLQLQAPFEPTDVDALVNKAVQNGAVVANIALSDPFLERPFCRDEEQGRAVIDQMNAMAAAFEAAGVEANLIGLPFCLVQEENRVRALNSKQFFLDHQQYTRRSYQMALALFPRSTVVAGKILLLYLGRYTSTHTPIDAAVLNYLMYKRQWWFSRFAAWHKLTRHWRLFRSVPKRAHEPDTPEAIEQESARLRRKRDRALGPICSGCCWNHICDGETEAFKDILRGVSVEAQAGETIYAPLYFSAKQRKYYDAVDSDRRQRNEARAALARKANDIVNNRPCDIEVDSFQYGVQDSYFQQMPGGVRWFSVTNSEKLSTPLATLEPPFTLAVTFGGGIAEYIGFALGLHCRLVCPMEMFTHRLVLHVEAGGHYILLRDGSPVDPVEFEGAYYAPLRLAGLLRPRISIWNIDHSIVTQNVVFWSGDRESEPDLSQIKYSVLVVCTRYARRLQAVLSGIAHQTGVPLRSIEVIVAYVPDIDATDDVIDSVRLAFPELRVVRSPFTEEAAHSKGFMINESVGLAAGEWIMLLDADVILPSNMFKKIEAVADDSTFIAPEGRKMLPPDVTAKILLGETDPRRAWNELLNGPGEMRADEAGDVPIGFCQCVRKNCFQKVKYDEHTHFEGADWRFAVDIRKQFGKEKRLDGVIVLHLDHGGSQWYGTEKHR